MTLRYVECPRDAWQGLTRVIPTDEKRAHLEALLGAGFRSLDLGSFVSPKAVPQLADTEEVLAGLERPQTANFLCIVANERGLERALAAPNVTSVGYPLSVNDTFQRRNTNRSVEASWPLVEEMLALTRARGLGLVVYLSMGFGNPYGEPWSPDDTAAAVARLRAMGIRDIVLADTVGTATPARLGDVLSAVGDVQALGLHLHARPESWQDPLEQALAHGLRWFEGALGGVGGCPFAGDELVGNLPTEAVLPWLAAQGLEVEVDLDSLQELAARARLLQASFS